MLFTTAQSDVLIEGSTSVVVGRDQDADITTYCDSIRGYLRGSYDSIEASTTQEWYQFKWAYRAHKWESPAEELIYFRIWVTQGVDFGLISENKDATVTIWNSNLYFAVAGTNFVDPLDYGILFESVTTPFYLKPNGYVDYTVTVLTNGPAEQLTTYDWVVKGDNFSTVVTGTRLLGFPFNIDWKEGERLSYEYHDSIFSTKTTHEQRRSLTDNMTRKSMLTLTLDKVDAEKISHLVRYARGRFFAVPIYNEVMYPQINLNGFDYVVPTESIEFYWNLQNYSPYVTALDYENGVFEVKTVTALDNTTIYFESDFLENYNPNTTVLFPSYVGMIAEYSQTSLTHSVKQVNINFREITKSGE